MAGQEPMVTSFIYETQKLLDSLSAISEADSHDQSHVWDTLQAVRIIKDSSATIMLDEVALLAGALEDIFTYLDDSEIVPLEEKDLAKLVLAATDFIRHELDKLDSGQVPDASSEELRHTAKQLLAKIQRAEHSEAEIEEAVREANQSAAKHRHYYIGSAQRVSCQEGEANVFMATLHFTPDCGMEDVRAYAVVNKLKDCTMELRHLPGKLLENESAIDTIRKIGFRLWFTTKHDARAMREELERTDHLERLDFQTLNSTEECEYWPNAAEMAVEAILDAEPIIPVVPPSPARIAAEKSAGLLPRHGNAANQIVGVRLDKLDRLMDIVGELGASEALISHMAENHEGLPENLLQAANMLHRLVGELSDNVLALRHLSPDEPSPDEEAVPKADELPLPQRTTPIKPKKIALTEAEGFGHHE